MTSVIKTVGLGRDYVAERADRKIVLRDGVISSDTPTRREVMT